MQFHLTLCRAFELVNWTLKFIDSPIIELNNFYSIEAISSEVNICQVGGLSILLIEDTCHLHIDVNRS